MLTLNNEDTMTLVASLNVHYAHVFDFWSAAVAAQQKCQMLDCWLMLVDGFPIARITKTEIDWVMAKNEMSELEKLVNVALLDFAFSDDLYSSIA